MTVRRFWIEQTRDVKYIQVLSYTIFQFNYAASSVGAKVGGLVLLSTRVPPTRNRMSQIVRYGQGGLYSLQLYIEAIILPEEDSFQTSFSTTLGVLDPYRSGLIAVSIGYRYSQLSYQPIRKVFSQIVTVIHDLHRSSLFQVGVMYVGSDYIWLVFQHLRCDRQPRLNLCRYSIAWFSVKGLLNLIHFYFPWIRLGSFLR